MWDSHVTSKKRFPSLDGRMDIITVFVIIVTVHMALTVCGHPASQSYEVSLVIFF